MQGHCIFGILGYLGRDDENKMSGANLCRSRGSYVMAGFTTVILLQQVLLLDKLQDHLQALQWFRIRPF